MNFNFYYIKLTDSTMAFAPYDGEAMIYKLAKRAEGHG